MMQLIAKGMPITSISGQYQVKMITTCLTSYVLNLHASLCNQIKTFIIIIIEQVQNVYRMYICPSTAS